MTEDISKWFARVFLGERYGRSTSKRMADNLGVSVNAIHVGMTLIVLGILGSRK